MTFKHLGAASVVALVTACSPHQSAKQTSPTQAAYATYLAGDYGRAEQGYAAILASDPGNATALLGMGEVMEASGRTSEALSYYRRAVASRNGAIRVYNGRQDGVTEVAYRRMGMLGGNGTSYAQQAVPQPTLPDFQAPPMYVEPVTTYLTQQTYSAQPTYTSAPTTIYGSEPAMIAPMTQDVYAAPEIIVGYQGATTYAPAPVQYQAAPHAAVYAGIRARPCAVSGSARSVRAAADHVSADTRLCACTSDLRTGTAALYDVRAAGLRCHAGTPISRSRAVCPGDAIRARSAILTRTAVYASAEAAGLAASPRSGDVSVRSVDRGTAWL